MSEGKVTMLNMVFLGEVASVQSYGAFVSIPSFSGQGLVHRSQISSVNVPDASEVVAKGDKVWCKVITVNEDGKIGLSMKLVDQGSGKDLDPNGVQLKLDEQRRKQWVPGGTRQAITLEAVFNTTCSKCGTRGHLSRDCFQVAGGKTYELLPEDEVEDVKVETQASSESLISINKSKKRKKKEKKKAKKAKKQEKRLKSKKPKKDGGSPSHRSRSPSISSSLESSPSRSPSSCPSSSELRIHTAKRGPPDQFCETRRTESGKVTSERLEESKELPQFRSKQSKAISRREHSSHSSSYKSDSKYKHQYRERSRTRSRSPRYKRK